MFSKFQGLWCRLLPSTRSYVNWQHIVVLFKRPVFAVSQLTLERMEVLPCCVLLQTKNILYHAASACEWIICCMTISGHGALLQGPAATVPTHVVQLLWHLIKLINDHIDVGYSRHAKLD